MVGMNGSECHFSSGPEGTTSVCPASTTSGRAVPCRIQRFVTSPCTKVSALNPSGTRRSMIIFWHPSSAGVMDLRAISALASSSVSFFKGDLPGEELPVHDPVAEEAVARVLEGRRAVLLEPEVADPCEAVARDGHGEQPPGVAGHDREREEGDHERGAREVQPAAGAVAMLGQVERVERGEGIEARDAERLL